MAGLLVSRSLAAALASVERRAGVLLAGRQTEAAAYCVGACGPSTSGTGPAFSAAYGTHRTYSSEAGSSKDASGAPPAAEDSAPTSTAPPSTSAPAAALAEELRRSSPTGRLLDLFAPPPGGRRGPSAGPLTKPTPLSPAAAEAAAAEAEAAAAAEASDVIRVVMRAVENCKPLMKVQQSKAGTKIVYVPKPLAPTQSTQFAVKWILQAAAKRHDAAPGAKGRGGRGLSMAECVAAELLLAFQRKGGARARRDEVHKLALDNRSNLRARSNS
ncbi:hypothetical protein HYH03_008039 [Edaphochlamys debaryana]|uniref:Small ribosomal subunit protein uS7 domain-containing protein n=1 Tax=Edaphochlamys debaryana TaxID=47281 RepID=A0A835Y477_9CHLO|nr:hypothetical protein HYH03_008039 [Edaphochlamys debaryana]|eukprot:KAG2493821.1 hypothetical protein HYH03_008039 [Edaphochlamys debaryana]